MPKNFYYCPQIGTRVGSQNLRLIGSRNIVTDAVEGFAKIDLPKPVSRTFKTIVFDPLINADIFSKLSSQNDDKIREAKISIFTFYNNCWNAEFGTKVVFTSAEHAGKIVGFTKEGKAWNTYYRREYAFFMSTHEQFSHLDLDKAQIAAFKIDAQEYSALKKRVGDAQTALALKHEQERKQLTGQLYNFVVTKNKFLGVMMVSEENLSIQQQMELLGITDESVRKQKAKEMVIKRQQDLLEDLKKGIPNYFPDLFGL